MFLLVYSTEWSPRLSYTLDFVVEQLWGWSYELTTDLGVYLAYSGAKLSYTARPLSVDGVALRAHSVLSESSINPQLFAPSTIKKNPVDFAVPAGFSLPFDPLANIFWMLSRYEEYGTYTPDEHGRFPAAQSWVARAGVLDTPVVWEWAKQLATVLRQKYPRIPLQTPGYQLLPTYDIDMPWAYLQKGLRGMLRAGMDVFQGKTEQLVARWRVLGRRQADPFFTFAQLRQWHEAIAIPPHIFWLLGDYSRQDVNPSHRNAAYRALIQSTSEWSAPGIHPSYRSFGRPAQLTREIKRLENILGQPIHHSRQHFLRFRLPETYRMLAAAGIQHDYSMGYASRTGYRAGIGVPFRWYDLERNHPTDLWIHPFVVMDVTLKNYLGYDVAAADSYLRQAQLYCQREQLPLSLLWHNSSFSPLHGWSGWRAMYEAFLFNQAFPS